MTGYLCPDQRKAQEDCLNHCEHLWLGYFNNANYSTASSNKSFFFLPFEVFNYTNSKSFTIQIYNLISTDASDTCNVLALCLAQNGDNSGL